MTPFYMTRGRTTTDATHLVRKAYVVVTYHVVLWFQPFLAMMYVLAGCIQEKGVVVNCELGDA